MKGKPKTIEWLEERTYELYSLQSWPVTWWWEPWCDSTRALETECSTCCNALSQLWSNWINQKFCWIFSLVFVLHSNYEHGVSGICFCICNYFLKDGGQFKINSHSFCKAERKKEGKMKPNVMNLFYSTVKSHNWVKKNWLKACFQLPGLWEFTSVNWMHHSVTAPVCLLVSSLFNLLNLNGSVRSRNVALLIRRGTFIFSEDEFAHPKLSKKAQQEITQQLIKDGYNLDLEPDDEDLDLIPPRPLNERCTCCNAQVNCGIQWQGYYGSACGMLCTIQWSSAPKNRAVLLLPV